MEKFGICPFYGSLSRFLTVGNFPLFPEMIVEKSPYFPTLPRTRLSGAALAVK